MFKFLTKIEKITEIAGALDIVFQDNLRVWIPPNKGEAFFTQPNNWLIDKELSKTPYNLKFLDDNERFTLGLFMVAKLCPPVESWKR